MKNIIDFIQRQKPGFKPQIGLILGSGLGALAQDIQDAVSIPFSDIPEFPISTVSGHKGHLILGILGNMPVACYQGRIHGYEGTEASAFKYFIRTLKLLGCESLLITNASGSLRQDVGPGELMLITDHINLQHRNPLIGLNEDEFGERFTAMDNAYDAHLNNRLHETARVLSIPLHDGVYMGVTGPVFETPAEIRAFKILGADCVGMSTVPEVLIARHCGLRVAAIASITNFGAGLQSESISHTGTLHYGQLASKNVSRLITATLESLHAKPC